MRSPTLTRMLTSDTGGKTNRELYWKTNITTNIETDIETMVTKRIGELTEKTNITTNIETDIEIGTQQGKKDEAASAIVSAILVLLVNKYSAILSEE